MKITFVIWALAAAGAERVLVQLANALSIKGNYVTIVTLDKTGRSEYPINNRICIRPLKVAGHSKHFFDALKRNFRALYIIRSFFIKSRPDLIISFIDRTNVSVLLSAFGLDIPVIVSERTDPSLRRIGLVWEILRRIAYPSAARVVVQSQKILQWLPISIKCKACIIPNPVTIPVDDEMECKNLDQMNKTKYKIVSIGRLFHVKGHDILIKAFAKLVPRHPQWSLVIWGEGPERAELEKIIKSEDLTNSVFLPGPTKRVATCLRLADIFVLPSRAEGFPNALTEAMACGVPVVSAKCGGAIEEIINDGVNGCLVPCDDVNALAEAMDMLMINPSLRAEISSRSPEVLERFKFDRILNLWDEAIMVAHPKSTDDRTPNNAVARKSA